MREFQTYQLLSLRYRTRWRVRLSQWIRRVLHATGLDL